MQVRELIALLSKYNPRAELFFHTVDRHEMEILSVYGEDGEEPESDPYACLTTALVDIDIGP